MVRERVEQLFKTIRDSKEIQSEIGRLNQSAKWPKINIDIDEEPRFLFVFTPPNSGSTALAKVLNSCPGSALLYRNGEGQSLIKGMIANDRWDPDKKMDWTSIRSVWLDRFESIKELVQSVDLIIEKSPPNLVRADQFLQYFPNHTALAFNRNPYANCSSLFFRHVKNRSDSKKETQMKKLAEKWLFRSRWIKKWIEELNLIYFGYENFCHQPQKCLSLLYDDLPQLRQVNINQNIKVKDYELQSLTDQNDRQIANLSTSDINSISSVLKNESDLVHFFEYEIL